MPLLICQVCGKQTLDPMETVQCSICTKKVVKVHAACTESNSQRELICTRCSSVTVTRDGCSSIAPMITTELEVTSLNVTHFNAIMAQLTGLSQAVATCNNNVALVNEKLSKQSSIISGCVADIAQLKIENEHLHKKVSGLQEKLAIAPSLSIEEDVHSEVQERMKREKNLIFTGFPVNSNDLLEAKNILQAVVSEGVRVIKGTRIGKSNNNKPQLYKVQLSSADEAYMILRNKAKIPKDRYPNLNIKSDLTPKQSKYLNELRDNLALRKQNGEADLTIKYINRQPQIVRIQPDSTNKRPRDEDDSPKRLQGLKAIKTRGNLNNIVSNTPVK